MKKVLPFLITGLLLLAGCVGETVDPIVEVRGERELGTIEQVELLQPAESIAIEKFSKANPDGTLVDRWRVFTIESLGVYFWREKRGDSEYLYSCTPEGCWKADLSTNSGKYIQDEYTLIVFEDDCTPRVYWYNK